MYYDRTVSEVGGHFSGIGEISESMAGDKHCCAAIDYIPPVQSAMQHSFSSCNSRAPRLVFAPTHPLITFRASAPQTQYQGLQQGV